MNAMEKLAVLKGRGVKLTLQRCAIMEFLDKNRVHPTAEEIFEGIRASYPGFSRATVYNSLEVFKRHGMVREIIVESHRARYDGEIAPHHHFLCQRCGRIYDVASHEVTFAATHTCHGHEVEECKVYLFGTCSSCVSEEHDA